MARGQLHAEIVKAKEYFVFVGRGDSINLTREKYSDMGTGTDLMNYFLLSVLRNNQIIFWDRHTPPPFWHPL